MSVRSRESAEAIDRPFDPEVLAKAKQRGYHGLSDFLRTVAIEAAR
jgi:hypothetical protein